MRKAGMIKPIAFRKRTTGMMGKKLRGSNSLGGMDIRSENYNKSRKNIIDNCNAKKKQKLAIQSGKEKRATKEWLRGFRDR